MDQNHKHPLDIAQESRNIEKEQSRHREIAEKTSVIVRRLSENLPTHAIPRVLVRAAKELFHPSKVGYFALTKDSNEFILKDCSGCPLDFMSKVRFHANEGILREALQKRVVVTKNDCLFIAGDNSWGSSCESSAMEVDVIAPIYVNSANMGVLVLGGCDTGIENERQYVAMLSDLVAGAFQKALMNESLGVASLDYVTGLCNRRYFTQWFEDEIRRAKNYLLPLSIFLFDIDWFKEVNDTYGHTTGDMILKELGEVIRRYTRSSDLVARYGGDEFVVVMTSANKDQALIYADSIRETIASTKISVCEGANPIGVNISGGVSSFPVDGKSTADLIQVADEALYRAKREGRGRIFPARPLNVNGRSTA